MKADNFTVPKLTQVVEACLSHVFDNLPTRSELDENAKKTARLQSDVAQGTSRLPSTGQGIGKKNGTDSRGEG